MPGRRKAEECIEDNRIRLERMDTWIEKAETVPKGNDHDHVRFLYFYIAYEAAYQRFNVNEPWKRFNHTLARHAKLEIINTLQHSTEDIGRLFNLRQASPLFWEKNKQKEKSPDEWAKKYKSSVVTSLEKLDVLLQESRDRNQLARSLNSLFGRIRLVRNQIVHGGSAGIDSRGRTQVELCARLLQALVPCIRDCIKIRIEKDWGKPPFPRVGSGPDDPECAPPWLDQ